MEDFPSQAANTELSSGNIVETWKKRRLLPLFGKRSSAEKPKVDLADTTETDDDEAKETGWVTGLIAKTKEKMPNPFKRSSLWGLQMDRVRADTKTEKNEPKEEYQASENLPEPIFLDENLQPREDLAADHTPELVSQATATSAGRNEGFLPISAEAIAHYQAETMLPPVALEADSGEINLNNRASNQGTETVRNREKVKIVNESIDHPVLPTNTLALSTGEILRRQRERQLRKEVKELKREAVNAKKEQEAVSKQQKEFVRQLDEQNKIDKRLAEQQVKDKRITIERMYAALAETRQPIKSEQPSTVDVKKPLPTPEVEKNKVKEIVSAPPERPEVILQTIEAAADKNVAVEGILERRHEVKDNDDWLTKASMASANLAQPIVNKLRRNGFYQPPVPMKQFMANAQNNDKRPLEEDPQLYRKAAYSGFWTAVVICLLILIVSAVH